MTNKRKLIYLFLDILLILGALLNVAMIDGGKWIKSVVSFYEPMEMADLDTSSGLASPDSSGSSRAQDGDQTESGCLIIPVPGIAEVVDATVLLIASDVCEKPLPARVN